MKIQNVKITDGDLIIIHLEGDNITQGHIQAVREKFVKWGTSRGLKDVEYLITCGEHKVNITKFTVNDVFEDEVLGGKKDG